MTPHAMSVVMAGGHGYVDLPGGVTPGSVSAVIVVDLDPAVIGSYADIPAFAGVTADGKLVFGPGPGANASRINGTYGFTLWTTP